MPLAWSVRFSDQARVQRSRLTRRAKLEVNQVRKALTNGPYDMPNAQELLGFPGIWRVRLEVGNRRMIYQVNDEQRTIVILEILRRDEAYDKYPFPDNE